MGLLTKKSPYNGPFKTLVSLQPPDTLFIGCNTTLFKVGLSPLTLQASKTFAGTIMEMASSKRRVLIATSEALHLLGEDLSLLKTIQLERRKVLCIVSKSEAFKVVYSGSPLSNQPVLRFLRTQVA